jgi:aldehyde:ferredoxin oxidoreductase
LSAGELSEMIQQYYRARGWDERGSITKEKLTELGLRADGTTLYGS